MAKHSFVCSADGPRVQGLGMIKAWLSAGWASYRGLWGQSVRGAEERMGRGWGGWLIIGWMSPGESRDSGESSAHRAGGIHLPGGVEIRDGQAGVQSDLQSMGENLNLKEGHLTSPYGFLSFMQPRA